MFKKFIAYSDSQRFFFFFGWLSIACFVFYLYLSGANGEPASDFDRASNNLQLAFLCLNAFMYSRIDSRLSNLEIDK